MASEVFHAGDWVEVRSREEILATLDVNGMREGMPFMPEMLQYCGRRFPVQKSAHKSCDTISGTGNRRMVDSVHLDLRCDGSAHGGCQAGCLLYWKNVWLKKVDGPHAAMPQSAPAVTIPTVRPGVCDLEGLTRATRADESRFRCQATEMVRASTQLKWWDPRHYLEDLTSRNVGLSDFVRTISIAAWNMLTRITGRGRPYPFVYGQAPANKTPVSTLDLQPGELVQVKPLEEIVQTINRFQKNRGLWFDVEMVPFCGKTFRVLRRVETMINEKNGELMKLPGDCIILEGVVCSGCLSRERLFCPRAIYPFWREIWLKRVE